MLSWVFTGELCSRTLNEVRANTGKYQLESVLLKPLRRLGRTVR